MTIPLRMLLVVGWMLECSSGVTGFITIPALSWNQPRSQVSPVVLQRRMSQTSAVTTVSRQFKNSTFVTLSSMEVNRPIAYQEQFQLPIHVPTSSVMSSSMGTTMTENLEYQRGIMTIAFITLLFSSNSPVLHAAFSSSSSTTPPPPVLLLNAAVSVVALAGLWLGGESLESNTQRYSSPTSSSLLTTTKGREQQEQLTLLAGVELGVWKFLATTANMYGLALTTAGHGALLIQLTTLIVPIVQGIQGVPIPRRIQASIVLALAGVVCFTQDPTGTPSAQGDALCVLAALFYATYDLRLFVWGKRVAARSLMTTKIGTQALLSVGLLAACGSTETLQFLAHDTTPDTWTQLLPVVLWSGIAVNAVAPFLQVGGQQLVGPTRCQTIYASQPLWAALISFLWLGETIGPQGMMGGSAFLVALFLAATTEAPKEDCGKKNCQV